MINKPNLRSDTYVTAYGYPSPNPVRIVFDTEEQRNKLLQSMREICGDGFIEPEILTENNPVSFKWKIADKTLEIFFSDMGSGWSKESYTMSWNGYFRIKKIEDLEEKLKELWIWLTQGGQHD